MCECGTCPNRDRTAEGVPHPPRRSLIQGCCGRYQVPGTISVQISERHTSHECRVDDSRLPTDRPFTHSHTHPALHARPATTPLPWLSAASFAHALESIRWRPTRDRCLALAYRCIRAHFHTNPNETPRQPSFDSLTLSSLCARRDARHTPQGVDRNAASGLPPERTPVDDHRKTEPHARARGHTHTHSFKSSTHFLLFVCVGVCEKRASLQSK